MRKILVGYDGSPHSLKAIEQAAELAASMKAGVLIATVLPDFMQLVHGERVEVPQAAARRAQEMVEEAARRLRAGGVAAEGVVLSGDVATELLRAAEERGCDLIVVGKRGLNNVESFLVGSVTEKVVKHTRVPVWVVV